MIELRMMLLSFPELGPCRRAGASSNTLPLFLEDLSEPQSGRTVNFEIEEINQQRLQRRSVCEGEAERVSAVAFMYHSLKSEAAASVGLRRS